MAYTTPQTATVGGVATAAMWNSGVRDNMAVMGPHLIIRKPSDETITSSITLQNDDHLALTVAANEVWHCEFILLWAGQISPTAGGLKVGFTFPTGGTLSGEMVGYVGGGTTTESMELKATTSPYTGPSTYQNSISATIPKPTRMTVVYVNGANAGTLQLQWAQQGSSATSTIMKANSTLWAVKLA